MRKNVVRYYPLYVQMFVVWYKLIETRIYEKLYLITVFLSTLNEIYSLNKAKN